MRSADIVVGEEYAVNTNQGSGFYRWSGRFKVVEVGVPRRTSYSRPMRNDGVKGFYLNKADGTISHESTISSREVKYLWTVHEAEVKARDERATFAKLEAQETMRELSAVASVVNNALGETVFYPELHWDKTFTAMRIGYEWTPEKLARLLADRLGKAESKMDLAAWREDVYQR